MAITQAKPKRGLATGGLETGSLQPADRLDRSPTLRTTGQRAEEQLLGEAGVDVLQTGGFARRDEIRQGLNERTLDMKRKQRAFNLAYRDAIKRGDRTAALNILLGAEKNGTTFGGISAAGRNREAAAQQMGEEYRLAQELQGRNSFEVATEDDMERAKRSQSILGGGDAGLSMQFDPSQSIIEGPARFDPLASPARGQIPKIPGKLPVFRTRPGSFASLFDRGVRKSLKSTSNS